ncbi:MAG TPA: penicillin acylase family protein, partial [Dongiaceae bacterium]|nr:penicillin acylase family protein [Dongiaceae bacterium]
ALQRYGSWGEAHRLPVQHLLGGLPVIGARYRFADLPAAGSSETVLKTAHALTAERHDTRYGAQARHISDLADPDANWFVLLGGQDGWFNSSTFRDQVEPFMTGGMVQVPLTLDKVRASFPHRLDLAP